MNEPLTEERYNVLRRRNGRGFVDGEYIHMCPDLRAALAAIEERDERIRHLEGDMSRLLTTLAQLEQENSK